jgi:hypothetical protein
MRSHRPVPENPGMPLRDPRDRSTLGPLPTDAAPAPLPPKPAPKPARDPSPDNKPRPKVAPTSGPAPDRSKS